MKPFLLVLSLLVASWLPAQAPVPTQAPAQEPAPAQPAAQPSVPAPWDVSGIAAALATQSSHLRPVLNQLTPPEWVNQGAPMAYVQQWQSAQRELADVERAEQSMEKQPDRMTLVLDTYFRLQSLETRLDSLVAGARRYQNSESGDRIVAALGESAANREKLRDYVSDLATQKEQELGVMDREAQRCRTNLNRQPAPAPTPAPRRTPAPKAAPKQP